MTVAELIEMLQKEKPDATVMVYEAGAYDEAQAIGGWKDGDDRQYVEIV